MARSALIVGSLRFIAETLAAQRVKFRQARPLISSGDMETPMRFALLTTVGALVALGLAHQLGMRHPWWASMTVWLVAQPTWGLLIERFLARIVGSAIGAGVGTAILVCLGGQPLATLMAMALWLALCAGLGSMFRYSRNYGCVLAGLTASIIVTSGMGDGIYDGSLATDRVLCTFIGIACSALALVSSVPHRSVRPLPERLEALLHCCLDRTEHQIRYGRSSLPATLLIAEIAALDHSVDDDAAGSLRGRREALRVHQLSGVLLELIALTPAEGEVREIAMNRHGSPEERILNLVRFSQRLGEHVSNESRHLNALVHVLNELLALCRQPLSLSQGAAFKDVDLAFVWRAGARPVTVLALTALIWLGTGWQTGTMMVMTATLFASLFSGNDQGNHVLLHVLLGSLIGVLGGLLVRLYLLPQAGELWTTFLCIAPFLLLGSWLMRRPSTAKMAIDVNMAFLLTAQPLSPLAGVLGALSESLAIFIGVLAAAATYWLFLPATPQIRRRLLVRRMVNLAKTASQISTLRVEDFHHRLRATQVRLLAFCDPGEKLFAVAQQCLAQSRLLLLAVHIRLLYADASSHANNPALEAAAGDALRRASVALSACLDPNPKNRSSQ